MTKVHIVFQSRDGKPDPRDVHEVHITGTLTEAQVAAFLVHGALPRQKLVSIAMDTVRVQLPEPTVDPCHHHSTSLTLTACGSQVEYCHDCGSNIAVDGVKVA